MRELLAGHRRMLPWVLAVVVVDVLAAAAFILGAVTDTAWATFTGLALIWVGAAIAIVLCLRVGRKPPTDADWFKAHPEVSRDIRDWGGGS